MIIGDLDEEFAQRAQSSPAHARGWYWRQALASIPSAIALRWRRASPLADLGGDVRRALRLLRRQPGFAAAAIVTMALGAGITTGVVSVVEAVLLRPLPYANGNRVYALQEVQQRPPRQQPVVVGLRRSLGAACTRSPPSPRAIPAPAGR